jgi:TolA-binding protein
VTGDPNAWGPIGGGGDPTCNVINTCIANDNLQIQTLQAQKASTTNRARIAQINQQIAGLQQDITSLQQQRREHHCP